MPSKKAAASERAVDEARHVPRQPKQLKESNIGIATAGSANLRKHLYLYGIIAPNGERVREVAARFPGVIQSVKARMGDAVKQGDTLATIASNESQTYKLSAPLTGVITARRANPGEQTATESLFSRDVSNVRVGQSVRVKSTDKNISADGKVVFVGHSDGATDRTLSARVLLDNADRRWSPGFYVVAQVTTGHTQASIAVRNESIQNHDGRNVVFVQGKDGFEPRPVELGRSDGVFTEVLAGLTGGETYATTNSSILKAVFGKGDAAHEEALP